MQDNLPQRITNFSKEKKKKTTHLFCHWIPYYLRKIFTNVEASIWQQSYRRGKASLKQYMKHDLDFSTKIKEWETIYQDVTNALIDAITDFFPFLFLVFLCVLLDIFQISCIDIYRFCNENCENNSWSFVKENINVSHSSFLGKGSIC